MTQLTTNKDKMSVTTALLMHGLIFCPDILGKPRNVTLYANLLITALKTNSFHESVSYLISGLLRLYAFSSQDSLVPSTLNYIQKKLLQGMQNNLYDIIYPSVDNMYKGYLF